MGSGEKRKDRIEELSAKYGVFKAAEFGIAGAIGFLVAEGIIVAGLYAIYGEASVPGSDSLSPSLLALDVFAFVVGVTVGFFVNERTTVRKVADQEKKGSRKRLVRLAKFQGVYALGNAITIGVQLALLAWVALSPAIGNIVGAVVAFPVSYFVSMRVVWRE